MSFLFNKIKNFKEFSGNNIVIPDYIYRGLAPHIKLRDYQEEALEYFLSYVNSDISKNKQIWNLFHMATGSGKTVIMAALILYYYNKGYRNFLFFVRNINIIDKTIDNLTNKSSKKYLFANPLEINGKNININKVDNFQYIDLDAINICFTSNSGLQNSVSLIPNENSLTMADFEDNKVVMIADESHHLNAETKHGEYIFEDEEDKSWESTTMTAFRANKDNVLLEFTATVDLANQYVNSKYKDVIVYDYPLAKFREQKYSKDIISLPSTDDYMKRVIISLLLSQYRYKLFQSIGENIKPIVMVKSRNIKERDLFYNDFLQFVSKELDNSYLSAIRDENKNSLIITEMFQYFESTNVDLQTLAEELKLDFGIEHTISIDSRGRRITAEDSIFLNNLELLDNPYRLIFVVDMLNEGWDVLNLFDIVRLYDTRDGKWSRDGNYIPGSTTISEMQLIGRGARYFPFKTEEWHEMSKRKFDNDINNPFRLCETLVYHCTNDNRYITEIRSALKKSGLISSVEPTKIELKVKKSFKEEEFYKKGFIFANERLEKDRKEVNELPSRFRVIPINHSVTPRVSSLIGLFEEKDMFSTKKKKDILKVKDLPRNILFKAIRQFPVLRFDNLKEKFPNLNTMSEFIMDDSYLGSMILELEYPIDYDYDNNDLFKATNKLFDEVAKFISKIEVQYEGTLEFKAHPVHKIVKDITTFKEILSGASNGSGIGQKVDSSYTFDLSNEDWYVYIENYGTSEEKSFVKYFSTIVKDFKMKYEDVFLIRNENQIGIYSFNTGERFEPDYLLLLGNKDQRKNNIFYQIFIEPKGSQFLGYDGTFDTGKEGWKQELFSELNSQNITCKVFFDNSEYKIWGLPFYNESETINEFNNELIKFLD